MNAPVMQNFSYDPFDPAVMADPLSYYRVLRDEHPLYYIDKWDTYALSRFDDIWGVLEINDGTFVASEGTLPAATVLATHNDGAVPDPPLHPIPLSVLGTPVKVGVRCHFCCWSSSLPGLGGRWGPGAEVKVERPQRSEDERP